MRWLTLPEVAEHLLEVPQTTARKWLYDGLLDGVRTKQVGRQLRFHPEAAWYFACNGEAAATIDDAYAWADAHPLPDVPRRRGAVLVAS